MVSLPSPMLAPLCQLCSSLAAASNPNSSRPSHSPPGTLRSSPVPSHPRWSHAWVTVAWNALPLLLHVKNSCPSCKTQLSCAPSWTTPRASLRFISQPGSSSCGWGLTSAWRLPSLHQHWWLRSCVCPHGGAPDALPATPHLLLVPSTGSAEVHDIAWLLRVSESVIKPCLGLACPGSLGPQPPGFHPSTLTRHPVNVSVQPGNIFLTTKNK